MESTGEPNRIQVSQATADLIQRAGKGHWLMARFDKVNAKSKGAMQTYWCDPSANDLKISE
jgi:Adenylate and Guanylate cyclase catalytic domain